MDKELSELGVGQIHCEDCIHFQLTRMGRNGGLWGKCELRDDLLVTEKEALVNFAG